MSTPSVLSTAAVAVGGALVPITIENTSAAAQTNVPVTFGQHFSKGQFPKAGAAVALRAQDNSVVPAQLDTKATHKDGSIKLAVISAIIPSIGASASVTYSIVRAASAPTGAAPVPSDYPALLPVFTLTDNGTDAAGPSTGVQYTANGSALLASGQYKTESSGPILSEWILRVPLKTAAGVEHPDLHVRFYIRAYKGSPKVSIDYCVENSWAKPKVAPFTGSPWENVSIAPVVYSYTFKVGNVVADTRAVNGYHRVRINYNDSKGLYPGNPTGIPNDGTIYTATITVDGVAKPISVAGSAIQTYQQVVDVLNAQLGGSATVERFEDLLGLNIKSNTTGPNSRVVITYGTLFAALKYPYAWRPIRGDEHIHYPGQWWMKTHWINGEPAVHIRHDKNYLFDSMGVPNYPKSLVGSPATIASNLAKMKANEDIGRNGMTKQVMSGQGYAPSIGILPEWVALYLVNQGKDAKYVMLKQADLGGSWPHARREYDTDEPIDFVKWPFATNSPNAGDSRNAATGLNEKLPSTSVPASLPSCPNQPDVAHHPDFFFVPYMVTGKPFYKDGLLFYFNYTCLQQNAANTYRDGGKVLFRREQTRGQAWMLRSLNHNRYLLPDNHPNRPALEIIAASNASYYNGNYVDPVGAGANQFGVFDQLPYVLNGTDGATSNFMEDFVAQALGRSVELGYEEWLPMLQFKSKHIKGRLTSGPDFCWQWADAYILKYKDGKAAPFYSSWKEIYDKSIPYFSGLTPAVLTYACGSAEMATAVKAPVNSMGGYPSDIGGFPSNLTPAVAYCAMFDMPSGKDAWLVLDSRTVKPDYNTGPQFDIEPRTFIAAELPSEPAPLPLVQSTDIELRRSGGANLGGALQTIAAGTDYFDGVNAADSATGRADHRCLYVYNAHPTKTLIGGTVWLSEDTPSSLTFIEIGLGTAGVGEVEQTISNKATAPVGVVFQAAAPVAGVPLGDIPPGQGRSFWLRRTVLKGAPKLVADTFTIRIEGKL